MNDHRNLDSELSRLADDPRLRQAMAAAAAELSEDLLLRYHAGELEAEEESRVSQLAAISPEASRFLAELAADQREAARVAVANSEWRRFVRWLRGRLPAVPRRRLSFAGAGVAFALATVILVPRMIDRPPSYDGKLHQLSASFVSGQSKEVVLLPGGRSLSLVDRTWPLVFPVGDAIDPAGGRSLGLVDRTWPLVFPVGDAIDPGWLVWAPVTGLATYDVFLVDAAGAELIAYADLSETNVKLPDRVREILRAGGAFIWYVEGRDAADKVVVRGVQRFAVQR